MAYIGNQTTTAFTSMAKQDITGNGGTGYTLDHAVANAQEIEVFVNNVRQEPGVAYTVSGTTLTMTGNVAASDSFYVVFQGKAIQTANHPSTQPLNATTGIFSSHVGINETSPQASLHINDIGSTGPALLIEGASSTEGDIVVTHTENLQVGHWNASTNTFTERFKIDTSGRITMPDQPVFYAVGSANFTHANGQYSTLATWNANINRGSVFSTTTGKFTAPVDGVYQITAGITFSGGSTDTGDGWGIKLWKNGSGFTNVEIAYAQGAENGVEGHSNITIYMDLDANDYVEMGGDGSDDTITILHVYFGGHLVG